LRNGSSGRFKARPADFLDDGCNQIVDACRDRRCRRRHGAHIGHRDSDQGHLRQITEKPRTVENVCHADLVAGHTSARGRDDIVAREVDDRTRLRVDEHGITRWADWK
jgi:hypothetical protein